MGEEGQEEVDQKKQIWAPCQPEGSWVQMDGAWQDQVAWLEPCQSSTSCWQQLPAWDAPAALPRKGQMECGVGWGTPSALSCPCLFCLWSLGALTGPGPLALFSP